VIIADDVGTDKVGCYGTSSAPPTPVLDGLAADGVRFENCWANPLCSPTRATLQTGRYSFRTGVGTALPFGPPLSLAERTLPEALSALDAEHATAAIGKWHLGGSLLLELGELNPNLQGYGHFAGVLAGAFVEPFSYDFWPRTVDGETAVSTTYATTANVDDALAWIGGQEGPWFLYLAFNSAHTPFHAPPAALHTQDLAHVEPCLDPVPFHNAMVQSLDTEIGRLLASLPPATSAATHVIFLGDNGTTGDVVLPPADPEHGKGSLYQGGVRVPLIVRGPSVVLPGRVETSLVNTSDLFTTVLELCGVDPAGLPGGAPPDSVSLAPYLREPFVESQRSHVFAEVFHGHLAKTAILAGAAAKASSASVGCDAGGAVLSSGKAIRNSTHKLIRFDSGREELYNLILDPAETFDLLQLDTLPPLGAAAYAELSGELEALLTSPG
jgi:arylsulfatase A-like enzyme